MSIHIICVEGPHGCGKTSICEELKSRGYNTIDEGFLDMPKTCLEPQSFTMETMWVTNWMRRILEINEPGTYYVDRSPYSAIVYAKDGEFLKSCIDTMMRELADVGRYVMTVYLDVSEINLWKRITDRLVREPDRTKYNEDRVEWMHEVVDRYRTIKWDRHIDANDETIHIVDMLLLF